ncbi:MAG: fibronectin type III domain-containing protein [Candidatus Thermoplasmatota archaeon]|nr:fibronectin type III domain-containing protein [Candidatus Thermoplasmatota archaeon]
METTCPFRRSAALMIVMALFAAGMVLVHEDDMEVAADWYMDLSTLPGIVYDDNVYCFLDDPPVFDGKITQADGWDDTISTIFESEDLDIRIQAKHDGEKIYLMIANDRKHVASGDDSQLDHIYFEDDGIYPERELDSENEDCKYVGVSGAPDGFRDAFHPSTGGWQVDGGHVDDGGCLWSDMGGWKIAEWWAYLDTGTDEDMDVTSNETLGFAIGWGQGWPGGDIDMYDASEWGSLHVIFDIMPTRIVMTYPEEGELIKEGEDITIEYIGKASDIEFRWDSISWLPMGKEDTILTDGVEDGIHQLEVRCTGNGGKTYTEEFQVNIDAERPEFDGIEICRYNLSSSGLDLGWDQAQDENPPIDYNIYIHREGRPADEFILEENTPNLRYHYTDIWKDQELTFKVRAVDAVGWEDLNDITMSITPDHSLPPIRDIDLFSIPAVLESDVAFCFHGTEPVVDGLWDSSDEWEEVPVTVVRDQKDELQIRSKHDGENIYFMFASTTEDLPDGIYLEDDGLSPRRELDPINEDRKYIGFSGYPGGYRDAHYSGGWPVDSPEGGAMSSILEDLYIAEFWFPLSTGSDDDINVTSNETLGFGVSSGVDFPDENIDRYDASTYGTLHVVYDEYIGDVSLFGPVTGSTIDLDTRFGLHVSMKDARVEYSINGGSWNLLTMPYTLTGDVLTDGDNNIEFRYRVDGSIKGSIDVDYKLDLTGPPVEIVGPLSGASIELPCDIEIYAMAGPDAVNVDFYFLDDLSSEVFIGGGSYSTTSGKWICGHFIRERDTSPVRLYAIAYDDRGNQRSSSLVPIGFHIPVVVDDDDIIVDDDDDIIVDDDDDIIVDDDDIIIDYDDDDPPSYLLYIVFIIIGIIAMILAVILAIVMGVKGTRDDREIKRDGESFFKKREEINMTADQAKKMQSRNTRYMHYTPPARPAPAQAVMEQDEREEEMEPEAPDMEGTVPMTETPDIIEEEFFIDEEPEEEEISEEDFDESKDPSDLHGSIPEDEESIIYGDGKKVPHELHEKARYLKEDGVVGGHIGAD